MGNFDEECQKCCGRKYKDSIGIMKEVVQNQGEEVISRKCKRTEPLSFEIPEKNPKEAKALIVL